MNRHIYRSLSLAKEVNNSYKIVFITSNNQKLAIQNLKQSMNSIPVKKVNF